jgi:ribosomal-protein-alanine N-acetyltransferase
MNNFPVKTQGTVRVRPFMEEHFTQTYIGWLNDPEVVRYSRHRFMAHTVGSVQEYYEAQKNSADYFLAIESIESTPVHIGNINISVNSEDNSTDLSILIGNKKYWGTGHAYQAWLLALDTSLDELGFRIAIAGTMETNKPMIRLMEKSGMNIDGILPRRFLLDGGEVGLVCASKSSTVNVVRD